MASKRYSIILIAALATAGVATFAIYRVLDAARAEARAGTSPVVSASRDIPEGATIDRNDLVLRNWPKANVPEGSYTALDSVVGRVTRIAVFRDEPIVTGRLAPSGAVPGIQVKITPGKRAMAVKIDDVAGVSGLIPPDSRVDVVVTLQDRKGDGGQVAKVFMSNMRVLAVGTVVTSGPDNRPINATTATLEVTPDEAERLAVAMREGPIQLVLRGFGDPDSVITTGARTNDVLAQLRIAPAATVSVSTGEVARKVVTPRRRQAAPPPPPAPPVVPIAPIVKPETVIVIPPPPARPDSHSVQVFRADKGTEQKFQKADTTKRKPGPPGSP